MPGTGTFKEIPIIPNMSNIEFVKSADVEICLRANNSNGALKILKTLRKPWLFYAATGNEYVLRWMLTENIDGYTPEVMDCAAENGHLNVVILFDEFNLQCTTGAMDKAALNGHSRILIW